MTGDFTYNYILRKERGVVLDEERIDMTCLKCHNSFVARNRTAKHCPSCRGYKKVENPKKGGRPKKDR